MTFIGGLRHDGMTAPWLLDGPIDGPAFITCIKTRLAPTLNEGDVVVLDNLPAHKVAAAQAAIKERGAWLLFLLPYSPDLNRSNWRSQNKNAPIFSPQRDMAQIKPEML